MRTGSRFNQRFNRNFCWVLWFFSRSEFLISCGLGIEATFAETTGFELPRSQTISPQLLAQVGFRRAVFAKGGNHHGFHQGFFVSASCQQHVSNIDQTPSALEAGFDQFLTSARRKPTTRVGSTCRSEWRVYSCGATGEVVVSFGSICRSGHEKRNHWSPF